MDIKKELQRLKEYREQLTELAKPGFGRFECFFNKEAHDELLAFAEDPSLLKEASESYRILCFDYFISIPLQEVIQCRHRFNDSQHTDELKSMEKQLQVLYDNAELSQDDISLLPDLFNGMMEVPSDAESKDKKAIETAKSGIEDLFKLLGSRDLEAGREEAAYRIFKTIAHLGQDSAVNCFLNKQAGIYRSFEWEIIEGILRSPIFPNFFTECEKAAGTLEISYEYRNWPERKFFLNQEERGKGVEKYIAYLHPAISDSFKTDEGYETFKKFMNQLALYGKIDNDANMEALLQLITGYHFEGAAKRVQWPGSDEEVRILFFIIKYISIASKGKYTVLQKGSNINYVGIGPESDVYKNLVDTYSDKKDPGRFLQGARGISDAVLISLHSLYSLFPETRDQA